VEDQCFGRRHFWDNDEVTMETIIGLGGAGCNIVEAFSKYPQYKTYMIDTEPRPAANFFHLATQSSHEEYEVSCPLVDEYFKSVEGPCLFVLGGGGNTSGVSLAILQQLSNFSKDVSILYVHPDLEDLHGQTRLQHNVVFGVLQEYARSGALSKIYIIQNEKLEEVLQQVPVIGYHQKINDLLVSTLHMINVFNNTNSEFDTFKEVPESARISTLGVFDVEKNEEKLFFDLTTPRERCYYFAINREQLETDGTILKGIKEKVKQRLDGKTRITYGIYSTSYKEPYGYCLHHSSLVQPSK
jgi:hypothetical protein